MGKYEQSLPNFSTDVSIDVSMGLALLLSTHPSPSRRLCSDPWPLFFLGGLFVSFALKAGQVSPALLPDRKDLLSPTNAGRTSFPKSYLASDPALHTNVPGSHPVSFVTWSFGPPVLSPCPLLKWTCPRRSKFYVELFPPLEQRWLSADFLFSTAGELEAGSEKPMKGNWMNILFPPIVTPSFALITLIETNLSHLSPITSHKGKCFVILLELCCCWTHFKVIVLGRQSPLCETGRSEKCNY